MSTSAKTPSPTRTRRSRRLDPSDPGAFGTAAGAHNGPDQGLVDPAWTRLAVACVVPILLAVTAPLPSWVRLALIVVLSPLMAQGWPALLRSRHDARSTAVISLAGMIAAILVGWAHDFGIAAIIVAFSLIAAFIAQMLRKDGRPHLLEDLMSTATGTLVVVCGAGWGALDTGTADPAVIVPCCLALLVGALLTTLPLRALVLESLTVSLSALTAGATGGVLAAVGFFGQAHTGSTAALQSAGACLLCGFAAGILMAAANRVLWTHRWVPGGRAAVASAIVPILAIGAPVYAIARLMGAFVAG